MKPIRKVLKVKEEYPTFVTPEALQDALFTYWNSMRVIGDDDEILIDLPPIINVKIIKKKGKDSRSRYRILNGGEKESI